MILSNPTEWEAFKKKHKCSCPLLDRRNPRWEENRKELYDTMRFVNIGLAQDIWWWTDGIYTPQEYLKYLTMPIEKCLLSFGSEDQSVQVLIEWRLKHGQDI